MNQLLEQFILEARDTLEKTSRDLLLLEKEPDNIDIIAELFRAVHTLKGNSGLFNFPAMTKVLHAAEDLMAAVRDKKLPFSAVIADNIFEAMDFISTLLDEIEDTGELSTDYNEQSTMIAESVKSVNLPNPDLTEVTKPHKEKEVSSKGNSQEDLSDIPESVLMECFKLAQAGNVNLVTYSPEESSFYKGEDPFLFARRIPGFIWGTARGKEPWPPLEEMDCYRCVIEFRILSSTLEDEIREHFKYVTEQVRIQNIKPCELVIPSGVQDDGEIYKDFATDAIRHLEEGSLSNIKHSAEVLLELSSEELLQASALRWIIFLLETASDKTECIKKLINSLNPQSASDPEQQEQTKSPAEKGEPSDEPAKDIKRASGTDKAELLLKTQLDVMEQGRGTSWEMGKIKSCGNVIESCLRYLNRDVSEMRKYLEAAIKESSPLPLANWLSEFVGISKPEKNQAEKNKETEEKKETSKDKPRRDHSVTGKILKVDQTKIDRLMDLIGEMVVSKNALPFLAERAENIFNVPELSRELKTQFNIINRIVEEMQDAVMQIRMVPVSIVFQRFPRLVRDISRKIGKKVTLHIEGEDTEAEKNIIESLADPLIHIIRNSLDHGIEDPDTRLEKGKPESGTISLTAYKKTDRVIIEIKDDGKGIDPETIKRKAYEKGLIDETKLERITSEEEAVNLVFLPGFSTAENISDISGRGVGMDVVKNAVERIGGEVSLKSRPGKGTEISMSLPLSMAVTDVMIMESHDQIFGIQMDQIVETVRIPENRITVIKHNKTTVLRDRLIPLYALTELLCVDKQPVPNEEKEYAVVIVRIGGEYAGIIVDDFREVVDIILKPLPGELGKLSFYSGTALLGDGSILMIINPKEFF